MCINFTGVNNFWKIAFDFPNAPQIFQTHGSEKEAKCVLGTPARPESSGFSIAANSTPPAAVPAHIVSTDWETELWDPHLQKEDLAHPQSYIGPVQMTGLLPRCPTLVSILLPSAFLCRTGALLTCGSSGPDLGPQLHNLCLLVNVLS